MKKDQIVFMAIAEYDNLGVGYMTALLNEAGYKTRVIDFRVAKTDLLNILSKLDPMLIGFSIIFLNYIKQFTELIEYLRKEGINCHFTAGGHYASLKYEELFQLIPQLDSIIRFEGEYPVVELAKCLSQGYNWRKIESLTYRENGKIICNPIWPVEKDLDKYPFPLRSPLKNYAFQKKFSVILAGRGCEHNCSFCNTGKFYRQASGPSKRIRKPEMVVREMNYLFHKKGCSVFLFHDDDFPVKSKIQNDWVVRFCSELERTGLNKSIIWKINCRPDEIEEEIFSLMKRNGLFLVFLGLEDGTDEGLKKLNKQMTVEKNVKGIRILKKLKIGFDYGFMLFQPYTTFVKLGENLKFLRQICGDGYTAATFLRLIPLYETRIEKELLKAGRLYYTDGIGDYDFPEEPMNRYYNFITDCFSEWLRSPEGVENISKWARNYLSVYMNYFDQQPLGIKYSRKIRRIITESNLFLLDTMKELSDIFKSDTSPDEILLLESYKAEIKSNSRFYKNEIMNTMAKLLSFAENQKIKI